jgi:hypothetical protein
VAKHKGVTITDHMWYKNSSVTTLFKGTNEEKFNQYLANLEDILKFCFYNDIPVLSYKEVFNTIYNKKQDALINVLPPLYRDLTSQGFPDGYILDPLTIIVKSNGVAEDKNYSLKRIGNGNLFKILSIGGFEKGKNKFSFFAKGADNANVIISIKSINEEKNYYTASTIVSKALESFVQFNTSIDIPTNVDLFTLTVEIANNNGNEIYLSGMYIGKAN